MKERGQLIISIDYESALGFADHSLKEKEKELIRGETEITKRLIELFETYTIPATWAITGHLLETSCTWKENTPHTEYKRPIHEGEKRDWFLHHPPKDEYSDSLWFDSKKLIKEVSSSSVNHEIASHSYGHIIYGDKGAQRDNVEVDLQNMEEVHRERHLPISTFIFPRNKEGHHDLLKKYGIKYYRGVTSVWYQKFPSLVGRGFHLLDYFLPIDRTVKAKIGKEGLINIPDSMLFIGRGGLRKVVPLWVMKWKMRRGLHTAIKKGEIFHLWFHPSNFWHSRDKQFSILQDLLKEADHLRKKGKLHIVTMNEAARKYQASSV